MTWLDGITESMDVSLSELRQMLMNRADWFDLLAVPPVDSELWTGGPVPPFLTDRVVSH